MSDKTKVVEVNGRKFQIRKFSARDGAFVIIKVSGIIAPMFKGIDLQKLQNAKNPKDVNFKDFDIFSAVEELSKLSEEDFNYLQDKSLGVCSEFLPNNPNPMPVVHEDGSFAVANLDDDTITVMSLMVHALMFNLKGFFQESPLSSLVGKN